MIINPTGGGGAGSFDGGVVHNDIILPGDPTTSLSATTKSYVDTTKQPIDATLTSLSALGTSANKIAYTTAVDTWAETPLTPAARSVLDDATVADIVNTIGGASSTGSGGLVRSTSPSLVTPSLGTANATGLNVGSGYSSNTPPTNGLAVQGNIGVGVGSAGAPITINGSNYNASTGLACAVLLGGGTAGSGAYSSGLGFRIGDTLADRAAITGVQGTTDEDQMGIAFFTHATTTGTDPKVEAMRITHDGKVGIGTTSPANALDVTGSISATGTVSAASMNVSGLTASYAVITDASKNFASIQYAATSIASALMQRDGNAGASARRFFSDTLILTDAATIAVNMYYANFSLTLGGNRTLGAPTNPTGGQSGVITVRQDATGSRTLAYAWPYVFPGGAPPTLSTAKFATDQLNYFVSSYLAGTCTMTIANPCVVTKSAHNFVSGMRVQFTTTGTLPTGISLSTTYWVLVLDANTFQLSTSFANLQLGTYVATSGTQSGTHTVTHANITVTLNAAINA